MDATHSMFCNDDLVNPLSSMGMQVSCILVVSHIFNVVLRTLGQPGPLAQILVINQSINHLYFINQVSLFFLSVINYEARCSKNEKTSVSNTYRILLCVRYCPVHTQKVSNDFFYFFKRKFFDTTQILLRYGRVTWDTFQSCSWFSLLCWVLSLCSLNCYWFSRLC